MLQTLKKLMFPTQVERSLQQARIDQSHSFMKNPHIRSLLILFESSKHKGQLLEHLSQRALSQDPTLKIKTLVVLHACVRQDFDEGIIEIIDKCEIIKDKSSIQPIFYLESIAINGYLIYLKKLCQNKQSWIYIREYFGEQSDQKLTTGIQIASHGFKILNLMESILQFQEFFNKMGRYYHSYHEILNLFLQFLQDLDFFNQFLKRSCEILLNWAAQLRKLRKKGEVLVEELQQLRHSFLFLTEAQKISDRLYQFYHNRYYKPQIKQKISFPSFLKIDTKEYKNIQSQVWLMSRKLNNKNKTNLQSQPLLTDTRDMISCCKDKSSDDATEVEPSHDGCFLLFDVESEQTGSQLIRIRHYKEEEEG